MKKLLILASFFAALVYISYENNFDHTYNLDSTHSVQDNPYIRDLKNIPKFFVDPFMFTILRANVDYRPILLVSFAINYALSQGEMWSYHLFQMIFHFWCVLLLYLFVRSFLPYKKRYFLLDPPFLVATLFAMHPYASGVVNYLSARSSLLTAVFVLASFLFYHRALKNKFFPWVAFVFFVFSMFTKVEAIAALGVYFLLEMVHQAEKKGSANFFQDALGCLNKKTMLRLLPFVLFILGYMQLRFYLLPAFLIEERSLTPPWHYFLTQTTAWWHYVLRWFAPVNLIADDASYTVYSSFFHPHVLFAITSWCFAFFLVFKTWKNNPYLVFFFLSFFILLSPTSSFAPLSEMVNEHRPYLPLAMLSVFFIYIFCVFMEHLIQKESHYLFGFACFFLALCLSMIGMTRERNLVFKTYESYWGDVVKKAPSCRALMNYGLLFMSRGNYEKSLRYFHQAYELAPNWDTLHINLGINYAAIGDDKKALEHYNRAVSLERNTSHALLYRGDYFFRKNRFSEALQDYNASLPLTIYKCPTYKKISDTYAKLGDLASQEIYAQKCTSF